jgi:hypothetical protein
MAKRLPASERASERVEQILAAGVSGEKDVRSELIRLGMRKIVEEALEAEVEARLGRGYYGREGDGQGYRNGYRTSRLKSAEGPIEFAEPQVSDLKRKGKGDTSHFAESRSRPSPAPPLAGCTAHQPSYIKSYRRVESDLCAPTLFRP